MSIVRRKPKVSDVLDNADFVKELLEAWRNAAPEARAKAVALLREAEARRANKAA